MLVFKHCRFTVLDYLNRFTFFLKRIIDGETRIGIFATRDIRKGEHLTYDYQYECLLPLLFHSLIMVESFIAYTVSILRKTFFFFCSILQNLYSVQSNKFSRFVQFGADQDCHCGSSGCRKKLGVKPSKPKMSSDAALKLVACQVAVSSPKLKAMMSGKDVCMCSCFMYALAHMIPFSFYPFLSFPLHFFSLCMICIYFC
jgi:histone-lysine N-methyltransferase SETD2